MQYFLNAFNAQTSLAKGLLPDMKLLQKMFLAILDTENAYKVQKSIFPNNTKDRMTHFIPPTP